MGNDRLVDQIQVARCQTGERSAMDLLAVKYKQRLTLVYKPAPRLTGVAR